ncbi:histidine ammonia-lyase [Algimonas porphyrae]|uniref:Histidine ammonia-lyase n=1 Tax=Algimonas porphyrae TaxID=1128113 RepID=A0ABQ5V1P3_9PROT|nr:histidine ammonia-lyase [Algimonas porphyrae]GLQ21391.1 histidine ammonia-lyase [Algimonas porphyrae]
MTIMLSPGRIDLGALERLYRGTEPVRLDAAAYDRVADSARTLQKALTSGNAIYGVNTGFGKLASVRIDDDKLSVLQRNLVRSHAAGFGSALPGPIVRLILILKLISLGRGASGVRPAVVALLEEMVGADLLPVIPEKGSVGASGDLAPLAHMALTMIGEGDAVLEGERMTASAAFAAAGLKPIELAAKEGLALLNGTQASTALALAGLFDARRLARASLVTCALSVDAAMGSSAPFHPDIHSLRGHRGQIDAAQHLRALLDGSEIRDSHVEGDERVQDPYCLRCAPQVIGACLNQLDQAGRVLETEANAATDNPLVLSDGSIVSGGNFHAEPVAFAADNIALAISEVGAIAQRRVALLVDPALSFGLPAFLAPDPGLKSGLMIAEVTSAALMSENKALANPRSVDSTPTSANQEDHVSMACHAARRLMDMNLNLSGILAVEAMAAAQGIELRAPLQTSARLAHHIDLIREHCAPLDEDRVVSHDIEALAQWLRRNDVMSAA